MGSIMQRRFKVGDVEVMHFYMPGKYLNDVSLQKLHNHLVQIKDVSKIQNAIKQLDKNLELKEIREHLKNTVIALGMINKVPYGFLIHPINHSEANTTVRTDFFFPSSDLGDDFNKIMVYGNLILLYERVGTFFSFGDFDLEIANIGKMTWYKYIRMKFIFFLLKKELKKNANERSIECEAIKEIICNQKKESNPKSLKG